MKSKIGDSFCLEFWILIWRYKLLWNKNRGGPQRTNPSCLNVKCGTDKRRYSLFDNFEITIFYNFQVVGPRTFLFIKYLCHYQNFFRMYYQDEASNLCSCEKSSSANHNCNIKKSIFLNKWLWMVKDIRTIKDYKCPKCLRFNVLNVFAIYFSL